MRNRVPVLVLIFAIASAAFSAPAIAARLANVLLSGSTERSLTYATSGWCGIDPGPSTFQRNGNGKAYIALADVTYSKTTGAYVLSGLATFQFDTATTGTAMFDYPGAYATSFRHPAFKRYKQTYKPKAGLLKVSFKLAFEGCIVPVKAVYRH